jgi:alpha-D-ribose 1-methylphosphonate 5-triphosphate synthase subunit PhnH
MEAKSSPMWHGKQQNLQVLKKELLRTTGLGVYCQLPRHNSEKKILIQASTAKALSPLQAEAPALLAARIAEKIEAQGVTFLTANLILARAASSPKITDT